MKIEEKYDEFFKEINKFNEKQEQQKMRGLNDYNIFTTILKAHDEVRLHSRMIASLLNTKGTHYQGSLFLNLFLETLNLEEWFNIDVAEITIKNEFHNIDIYITNNSKHIIIENKIHAKDQKCQIKRYIDDIYKLNPLVSNEDVLVIYLSINRNAPSKYSLGTYSIQGKQIIDSNNEAKVIYKNISYKIDILDWLTKCKNEIKNITNLNEAFEQYIQVVNKITNQYKGKIMTLKEKLMGDIKSYRVAREITNSMPKIRKDIVDEFLTMAVEDLKIKLEETNWIIEIEGDLAKRYKFPLRIYKESWKQNNYVLFGFEFENDNYLGGIFGLIRNCESIVIRDIKNQFKDGLMNISSINPPNDCWNSNNWWLFRHNIPKEPKENDFVDYIINNGNFNCDNFVNIIMEYIKTIEMNTKLVSEINTYLKTTD